MWTADNYEIGKTESFTSDVKNNERLNPLRKDKNFQIELTASHGKDVILDDVDFSHPDYQGHIACILPYFTDYGDCTEVYYTDGRHIVIKKALKTVFRDMAAAEGLTACHLKTACGSRPMYTDPRTLGPHMTFASLKVRMAIGRSIVYGLFNVAVPFEYIIDNGESSDTCFISFPPARPVLIYHTKAHVRRKLAEALREHMMYMRNWFEKTTMTQNKFVISEIYNAWRTLSG